MAAAALGGLIPVLHSVATDQSSHYVGRQLWFGLIAIYGVVVYVVHTPWVHIHEDFQCHGTITYPCLMECFEKSFHVRVTGTWYLFYFIFLTLFFLMEFVMSQIEHRQVKVESMGSVASGMVQESLMAIQEQHPSRKTSILNFHQEKMQLLLYLLHLLLQASVQVTFLFILTFQHLPLVRQASTHCSTNHCPGPYLCLLRATMEKRMSIYSLLTLSCMNILFCTGFFLYSIYHYLLKSLPKTKDLALTSPIIEHQAKETCTRSSSSISAGEEKTTKQLFPPNALQLSFVRVRRPSFSFPTWRQTALTGSPCTAGYIQNFRDWEKAESKAKALITESPRVRDHEYWLPPEWATAPWDASIQGGEVSLRNSGPCSSPRHDPQGSPREEQLGVFHSGYSSLPGRTTSAEKPQIHHQLDCSSLKVPVEPLSTANSRERSDSIIPLVPEPAESRVSVADTASPTRLVRRTDRNEELRKPVTVKTAEESDYILRTSMR